MGWWGSVDGLVRLGRENGAVGWKGWRGSLDGMVGIGRWLVRLGRGNGWRRQVVVGRRCVVFPWCIGVSAAKLLAGVYWTSE